MTLRYGDAPRVAMWAETMHYRDHDHILTLDGQSVVLRRREGEVLRYLLDRAGQVVTRAQLERDVWGFRAGVRSEVAPVTVRRLRSKLGKSRLETVFGRGWRLVPPDVHPCYSGPFVGRTDEASRIREALKTKQIVTLVGPGGVGKTRLALEVGPNVPSVVFCDMTRARTGKDAAELLAQALGGSLGEEDPIATVATILEARPPNLYVLDNLEQLIHDATFLDVWAGAAGHAQFLVTSRERLGSPLEQVVRVQPLSLEPARVLFRQRVSAIAPEVDLDEDPLMTDKILSLLDGLPLAIELAAARAPLLHPALLFKQLSDRFRVLVDRKSRGRQTLEHCIQWSWDLLNVDEQSVLEQISVFGGPFGLDDFEAVVVAPGSGWLGDTLQSLVEKSLVQRRPDGRFGVLLAVSDFASRRLAEHDIEGHAFTRHAAWFGRHGELPQVFSLMAIGTHAALETVRSNRGEIETAVTRWASLPPTVGCALARASWVVLRSDGPVAPGLNILDAALARAVEPSDVVALAALRFELGVVRSRFDGLDALFDRVEPLTRSVTPIIAAEFHRQFARVLICRHDLDDAQALLEKSLALHQQADEGFLGMGAVFHGLARVAWAQGLRSEAKKRFAQALEVLELGSPSRVLASTLCNQADFSLYLRHFEEARAFITRARRLILDQGFTSLEGKILWIAGRMPDADETEIRALLTEHRSSRQWCTPNHQLLLHSRLAMFAAAKGDLEGARTNLERAVEIARAADPLIQAMTLGNLAHFHIEFGQAEDAIPVARLATSLLPESATREAAISYCALGVATLRLGRPSEAREWLEKSEEAGGARYPSSDELLFHAWMRLAVAEGDVTAASAAVSRFSRPYSVRARLCQATVAATEQQFGRMRSILDQLESAHWDTQELRLYSRQIEALRGRAPS